jgi:lipopolysaccharide export system permease protein
MRILDLYIARAILTGTVLALLVLTALDVFFALIGEFEDVGEGGFGYRDAFVYIVLTLPARVYTWFPAAVLVGSLLSLGTLAAHSELVAMRASGVSVRRIVRSAAQAGLVLLFVVALMGEFVVPPAERIAQSVESKKQGLQVSGVLGERLWVRDGQSYINIGHVYPELRLQDITIHRFGEASELLAGIHVESAFRGPEGWEMHGVKRTEFDSGTVKVHTNEVEYWPELLDPRLFNVLTIEPETMSARDLNRYIEYLDTNKLDSASYRLAFWLKIVTPVSCVVMLFIVLPFVFGSLRTVGSGQLLVIGILLGLGFYILIQIASRAGQIYGIPPFISATFPVALFTVVGLTGLTKVR